MTTTFTRAGPSSLGPALLGSLRGTVLELGPGAGANLPYYSLDVRLIGIEPDAGNRDQAARLGLRAQVLPGRAERLDLPDGSIDAAVATFVLCSVDDPTAALAELYRVLRPGGRYVFAEHVAAPAGTWLRRGQNAWTRVTGAFGTQCRLNRDSLPTIQRAGFHIVDLHRYVQPGPLGTALPHITGAAQRPATTNGRTP
jgi:SAM-dependent methyltransferase